MRTPSGLDPSPRAAARRDQNARVTGRLLLLLLVAGCSFFLAVAISLWREGPDQSGPSRQRLAQLRSAAARVVSRGRGRPTAKDSYSYGGPAAPGGAEAERPALQLPEHPLPFAAGNPQRFTAGYELSHAEPECALLLRASAHIMFLVIGGRGYHDLRVRVMLRSWARCLSHVLIFTDPSVDVSDYVSSYRFIYLIAGEAWRKRPYLPFSHMDDVHKLLTKPRSPAYNVSWFFLLSGPPRVTCAHASPRVTRAPRRVLSAPLPPMRLTFRRRPHLRQRAVAAAYDLHPPRQPHRLLRPPCEPEP